MPMLLATLALSTALPTQIGKSIRVGGMTAPKPGALAKIPKIPGLGTDRPRIALLPLWVTAPVPSETASASAKALVDASATLEKTSKAWGFTNTKLFHKKIETYAGIAGGPWEAPEIDKIAASMKADYVGRLTLAMVAYFGEDQRLGTTVRGYLQIRNVKTGEISGVIPFLGVSQVTIGEPKPVPTIPDAVYDLVANRLSSPETLGQPEELKNDKPLLKEKQ